MGDRCSVSIVVRPEDVPATIAFFGTPEEQYDHHDNTTCLYFNEINYGFSGYSYSADTPPTLELPFPYYGYHMSGESYPGFAFACDGTTHSDVEAIDGAPCLVFQWPPYDEATNQTQFDTFVATYARARAALTPGDPAHD
jgi:hypothetical protein